MRFFFADAPIKVKVKADTSQRPKTAGAYSDFISMKHLEVLLLPPDGMLVHHRVTPNSLSPVPSYTLGPVVRTPISV